MSRHTIVAQDGSVTFTETGEDIKSAYTIPAFLNMIPKASYRLIREAADAADGDDSDNILFWVNNVPALKEVNLNTIADEAPWFIEGLQSMVNKGIFTQTVVTSFLEL